MQNPELDVHLVRLSNEGSLFLDLIEPFADGRKETISPYRLKHIVPYGKDYAFAVYEIDHGILAVQFFIDNELVRFGDDEPLQFMSVEEIRLLREIGCVSIDGEQYRITGTVLNLVDGPMECRHMVVFNLANI